MGNCEAMTSSTRSFAYSYQLVKKCFLKICETSKCHNFLIFQPIFIRFSLFHSQIFTLSYEIKLNLFRISPLNNAFNPYPTPNQKPNHCPHSINSFVVGDIIAGTIFGSHFWVHIDCIGYTLNLIEDTCRWKFHKCKMVYHALNDQSPLYLSDMFVHSHSLHNHRTRSAANMGLIIPRSRTQMGKRRFSHEAAAYWNQLPNIVRQAPSKESFANLYTGKWYHDL